MKRFHYFRSTPISMSAKQDAGPEPAHARFKHGYATKEHVFAVFYVGGDEKGYEVTTLVTRADAVRMLSVMLEAEEKEKADAAKNKG